MSAAEDHANLLDTATRLFKDSAEDIDAFVTDAMKRLGYKPRIEWDDPEPEPGNGGGGGGDFFDRQRQRQRGGSGERRRVGGDRQPEPQRRAGGFGGEYGS